MVLIATLTATSDVYDVDYPDLDAVKRLVAEIASSGGELPIDLKDGDRPHVKVNIVAYPHERYYALHVRSLRPRGRLQSFDKTLEIWVIDDDTLRVRSRLRIKARWRRLGFPFRFLNPLIGKIVRRIERRFEHTILRAERRLLERVLND